MKRKLITWLIALTASAFVLPYATCATSAINGVVQAWKPCDVLNCVDPPYFNPCAILNCNRGVTTTTTEDTTTTTE